MAVEKRYCRMCGLVTKGIKDYYFPNSKNNLPSREVCGGGCNADWESLERWNQKQIEVYEKNQRSV